MFSKKTIIIGSVIAFIVVNISLLSFARSRYGSFGPGRVAIVFIAPFQKAVGTGAGFLKNIWNHYFSLVSTAKENDRLRQALGYADADRNQWQEISDGLKKGLPVIIPEGIAGHITEVTSHYAKVLLIFDQNSAVDAFVQRTRARGIVKGETTGRCVLKYVLQKHDIRVGDTVVSSGWDGVFPKGLRIGYVSKVVKRTSGIFQEIKVTPYVDFDNLEEVLVILNPPDYDFMSGR
ncbi:MAG: rod shape-determining protein MreC [Deltaproteobacteria bacterium]|nr:rod shape-determining protein MreC [Deltaproteobacteria bacterium]